MSSYPLIHQETIHRLRNKQSRESPPKFAFLLVLFPPGNFLPSASTLIFLCGELGALFCLTYTINAVDEGIVTAVAHGQPMAAKEDYVDVSVAGKKRN